MADTRTVEELMALLGSDDDSGNSGDSKPQSTSNPMSELRKQLREVLKEKKERDKQVEQLSEELATFRQEREEGVFSKLQVDEKKRELFKRVNPDAVVTEDAVLSFLNEFGIGIPSGEGDESDEQVPDAPVTDEKPDIKPTQLPGQTSSGQKVYTPAEWDELNSTNPAAAYKALQEGRISRDTAWPGGPR